MKTKWRRATIGGASFTNLTDLMDACNLPDHLMAPRYENEGEVEFLPSKDAMAFLMGESIDDETYEKITSERSPEEEKPDSWDDDTSRYVEENLNLGNITSDGFQRSLSEILPTIIDDDEIMEADDSDSSDSSDDSDSSSVSESDTSQSSVTLASLPNKTSEESESISFKKNTTEVAQVYNQCIIK